MSALGIFGHSNATNIEHWRVVKRRREYSRFHLLWNREETTDSNQAATAHIFTTGNSKTGP